MRQSSVSSPETPLMAKRGRTTQKRVSDTAKLSASFVSAIVAIT
jgi:hypothetical protein